MRVLLIALLAAISYAQTAISECTSNALSSACEAAVLNACPYLYVNGLTDPDLNGFYAADFAQRDWNGKWYGTKTVGERGVSIYFVDGLGKWMYRATNPLVLGVPNGMDKAEEFENFPPNGDDWAGWDSTVARTVTVLDVTMSCSEVDRLTTVGPSVSPSFTDPTVSPSPVSPTTSPSPVDPSLSPSVSDPTKTPTNDPSTTLPSSSPSTTRPSDLPSLSPSFNPSFKPSSTPSSSRPTELPSDLPSTTPSHSPSESPSVSPEYSYPTHSPSMSLPTLLPSAMPTSECSTIELYQGVCNTQQGVNWVVAVDSSTEVSRDDYDEIKAWVVDFQQNVIPRDDESTFGIIQFSEIAEPALYSGNSDSRVSWQIRALNMNQHNSSETFIAPAINLASEMFAAVSDVRRDDVFVLIVASEPDDSTCRNYNYLGEQGVLVMVVAIGDYRWNSVSCLTPTSHEFVTLDSVDELATFDASPILCQQTYFGGGFNRLPESQMEQGKYIFENPYGNILQYTPDQLWAVFDPSHSNALISVGFGGFDIPEGDLYPTDKQCWDQIVEDDTVYANTFMCHIRIVCSTTMVPSLTPTASDEPSKTPTPEPTPEPSNQPTPTQPTKNPSVHPTPSPTTAPSDCPSKFPSLEPTFEPTDEPSLFPSKRPTTSLPTVDPTPSPTEIPSVSPSRSPTYPATRPPSPPDQPCNYVHVEEHENPAISPFVGFYTTQPDLRNDYLWFKFVRWDGTEEGEMFVQAGRWFIQINSLTGGGFFTTFADSNKLSPPDGATWELFDGQRFDTIENVGIYCALERSDWTDFPSETPSSDMPTVAPTRFPTLSMPSYQPSIKPSDAPSLTPTAAPSSLPTKDPTPTPIVYFWLNFTEVLVCSQGLIQISEVKFSEGVSIETIEAINESGSPENEGPERLGDGSTSSKWLDFGFVCESQGGIGKQLYGTLSAMPEWYEVYTANDSPRRDPIKWDIHICAGEFCYCDFGREVESNWRRYASLGQFGFERCFTGAPTGAPSVMPSDGTTDIPTKTPSVGPTTPHPSGFPSVHPTANPTPSPTTGPSDFPSVTPTDGPTNVPTLFPSSTPSKSPSLDPTSMPTPSPTNPPHTSSPTITPTKAPSTTKSLNPTTSKPTSTPTESPTPEPTRFPSTIPSHNPSITPSVVPTATNPSRSPSADPTRTPSDLPSAFPTPSPTESPTDTPSTSRPTVAPSDSPSGNPTPSPTHKPSASPFESTAPPSARPTDDDFFVLDENIYVWMTQGECMDVEMERFDQLILSVSQEVCARNCNLYRDCLGISVGNFWTLCQMAFMDGTLPNPLPEGWGVSDDTGSGTTQEVGSESNINQGFLNCYRRIRPPTQRPTTSPTSSPTNKPSQSPTISSPSTAPSSHMPSVAPTFTTLAPTRAPSFTPVTSAPSIQPTIQPTLPHPTKAPTTLLEIPIHTINDDFRYVFPGVCKDANGDDFDGIIIRDVGNTQACADHCARYNACLGFTWFPTGLMCSLMFQDETWPKEYLLFNWALSDTGDGHTCIIGDFEQTTNVEFFQCFKRLRDPICATQIVVTSTTTELQTTLSPSISPSTTTTTTTTTTLKPTSSVSNCDDLQDDTDAYVQCLKNRISSLENRVDNMETTCRSYCDNLKNEIEFSLLRNSCDS